jgi:4-cresol dehydrogenase (hydroxylating)
MDSDSLLVALIDGLRAIDKLDVVVDADALERISRTCIPYREIPSVAVFPYEREAVQAVVRVAREFGVPVWPVSTGKNFGYGEKTACYPGGITMVLDRMTGLEINEKLGYAEIEPGVTYKQLNDELKTKGFPYWADTAGTTQYASVLGNALDKGRGLTPYADHFANICGMDVVLPDGELLETGGGPTGRNKVRHTYKHGVGPVLDGLFAQSNLGIVVKAGIWLMPAPERFDWAAFEYTKSRNELGDFIEKLQQLVAKGALRSRPHLANDFAMMCIVSQYPNHLLGGASCLSAEAMRTWRKEHGVAEWTFGCGVYGSREEVRFQKREIKALLGPYGRVQFVGRAVEDNWVGRFIRRAAPFVNRLMGKSPSFVEAMIPAINLFRGIPTDHFVRQVYFKSPQGKPVSDIDPARDQCGFLWIGPVLPFTSDDVMEGLELAEGISKRHGFDFFVEIIVESARSVFFLLGVFYERADPADQTRAQAWYQEARSAFLSAGYPPYRETTMSMSKAADANPVHKSLLAAIKLALDPQNVIAPGRYGTPSRAVGIEKPKPRPET